MKPFRPKRSPESAAVEEKPAKDQGVGVENHCGGVAEVESLESSQGNVEGGVAADDCLIKLVA